MTFTDEQRASFRRDGYIILSGLFEPDQIAAAREEAERLNYGKSFEQYLEDHKNGIKKNEEATNGRQQFPTGTPTLDSLIENEKYLDAFAGCLGTDDLTYINGHIFSRSGPDDNRHAPEKWGGYHIDDGTGSFLPPHPDVFNYNYINSWVMLHDIEEDGAPLQVLPGSHLQIAELMPRLVANGDAIRGNFRDIREVPEFAAPVSVVGKAGDTLLYSSYLVHGAIGFANKQRQRTVWTISVGRGENDAFTKFSHLYQYSEREYSIPFWNQTSPRVRSLFGWPAPGDAYYTPETLNLLSAWFPSMDLSPYGG